MAITPADIKKLRELSGAGMMDCKKALKECDGDLQKATQWLRENGLSKVAKKEGRIAAEGLISMSIADDNKSAVLNETNSETDFVAKNDKFIALTDEIAFHIHTTGVQDVEELMQTTINGVDFKEHFDSQAAVIGEKLVERRFAMLEVEDRGVINGYVHSNGRIGVLVAAVCDTQETANKAKDFIKQIAMHAAAMKPTVLSYKDLDSDFVAKENAGIVADIEKENEELARLGKPLKKIPQYVSRSQLTDEVLAKAKADLEQALKEQGKPEKIWDKIIPGQLDRFISDNTQLDQQYALLDQFFIMDDKISVAKAIQNKAKELNGEIEVIEFVRYEVGEGIEKKEDNFAQEVAAQLA